MTFGVVKIRTWPLFSLFIDVKIPKNTIANINKVYVQEAIRILLQSDLEALAGESPEEILQKFRFFFAKK